MKLVTADWNRRILVTIASLLIVACAGRPFVLPPVAMRVSDVTCLYPVYQDGILWCLTSESKFLSSDYYVLKIDLQTPSVVARIRIPEMGERYSPTSLVVGEGAVWVAFDGFPPRVHKVHFGTNRVIATIPIGTAGLSRRAARLSVGEGAVWVGTGDQVFRIDPVTNELSTLVQLGRAISDVFVVQGSLWVLQPPDTISRIDLRTKGVVARIPVPPPYEIPFDYPKFEGRRIAFGGGSIWVVLARRWTLAKGGGFPTTIGRLDPYTNQIVSIVDVGTAADGVAYLVDIDAQQDAIVVSSVYSVLAIDPTTNAARRILPVGSNGAPNHLSLGANAVWLTIPRHGLYRVPLGH